ncbi:MAG TPA: hypothetical protein VGM39_02150, partial [Kofleriaceae bacterium]
MSAIGILGIGLYLPPEVRTNAWWPSDVVQRWRDLPRPSPPDLSGASPGARQCFEAMAKQAPDPFAGVRERRVMPSDMTLLDMEEAACRSALANAGIAPTDVTLLLTNRTVPEVQLSNPAAGLHARLGLPHECLSTHLDVATHSFMMQLSLAEGMIAAGRARYALLVQSCAPSRLIAAEDPISPNFGDAATAVLIGAVPAGTGILSSVMYTDGRYPTTLVASVPGAPW